jgi:hypothetical protein
MGSRAMLRSSTRNFKIIRIKGDILDMQDNENKEEPKDIFKIILKFTSILIFYDSDQLQQAIKDLVKIQIELMEQDTLPKRLIPLFVEIINRIKIYKEEQ